MAALMRHGAFKTAQIKSTTNLVVTFATKAEKKKGMDRKLPPKIDSSAESIAAKGFLRPQKSYTPPSDVTAKLSSIYEKIVGGDKTTFQTGSEKFNLFTACSKEFDHSVPNSLLHTIETFEDLKKFYETPVDTVTPLDKMRSMELPENLHVQFEYHRFHPESDTKFEGQTAFNRSSTLVTGLKYKDKYKGHIQEPSWPFNT